MCPPGLREALLWHQGQGSQISTTQTFEHTTGLSNFRAQSPIIGRWRSVNQPPNSANQPPVTRHLPPVSQPSIAGRSRPVNYARYIPDDIPTGLFHPPRPSEGASGSHVHRTIFGHLRPINHARYIPHDVLLATGGRRTKANYYVVTCGYDVGFFEEWWEWFNICKLIASADHFLGATWIQLPRTATPASSWSRTSKQPATSLILLCSTVWYIESGHRCRFSIVVLVPYMEWYSCHMILRSDLRSDNAVISARLVVIFKFQQHCSL